MAQTHVFEKSLALVLVVAVGSLGFPAIAAPAPAALSGKLLRAASGTPLVGAVVKLSQRPQARIFESAKADPKGYYSLSSLPPGTYDVAVETDGGLYLVARPVSLQPAERLFLSLSIIPNAQQTSPPAPDQPKPSGEPEKEKPKPTKKKGFFHSAWGGVILVLGSAAVIGAVVNSSDNDEPASASPSSD